MPGENTRKPSLLLALFGWVKHIIRITRQDRESKRAGRTYPGIDKRSADQIGSIMDYQRAAVYALGVTLALNACSQGPQHQVPPLSVDVAAATRQNIATYVSLDGQVAPLEQSVLAFQQNGTITSIAV